MLKTELIQYFFKVACTNTNCNIPILPEAFLTFASKSCTGPSFAAHGPYTPMYTLCYEVRTLVPKHTNRC